MQEVARTLACTSQMHHNETCTLMGSPLMELAICLTSTKDTTS